MRRVVRSVVTRMRPCRNVSGANPNRTGIVVCMNMEGRVALVTGGGRRLGRAFALGLAGEGADVIVHYHQSRTGADEVVSHITATGRRGLALQADLGRVPDARALIEQAVLAFGRLDILVNSAASFERKPVAEITEQDWDRVLALNLRAPFFLAQAATAALAANSGVIINIADLSALQAWPTFAHHATSKAGLVHLTRVLARALAPAIRVNAILPGTVLPPGDFQGEDWVGGRDRHVVGREGRPQDVVDTLLWLVRSEFVTGQAIVVDGGRMLL